MVYIALSSVKFLDLRRVNIESEHTHARTGELKAEGQAYIAETNNCDFHSV